MNLSPAVCYRAVLARDARYDGRFFTCVKSTGIFCRPICPARPPRASHCLFVPTAAAAQEAGFRPCLRCRPESSPGLERWEGTSATVSRALKLIEGGALDEGDVDAMARRLDVGSRQLRRLFRQHLGASPVAVAQTRRLLLAKQLLDQTGLSMIDVAMASGFGSVRRFNEAFQRLYQRPPRDFRTRKPAAPRSPEIVLFLPYRPPYDWEAMREFLRRRAIKGVETVNGDGYSRVIEWDGALGSIAVSPAEGDSSLRVAVRFPRLLQLPAIIARVRRMFDLNADPGVISEALSADPVLAPLVAKRPGLRVLGGWDGFEIAVRAILGQQITVEASLRLAGQLAAAAGTAAGKWSSGLAYAFPSPAAIRPEVLQDLRLPRARRNALLALAAAVCADPGLLDPRRDLETAVRDLRNLRGIGEWTAQYIAMRALGEPDAFPVGDAGVRRALARGGSRLSAAALTTRAKSWRPWRAYAVLHLWMSLSDSPTPQPPSFP